MEYKKDKDFITLSVTEIEKFVKNYNKIKNNTIEINFNKNILILFNFLTENYKIL